MKPLFFGVPRRFPVSTEAPSLVYGFSTELEDGAWEPTYTYRKTGLKPNPLLISKEDYYCLQRRIIHEAGVQITKASLIRKDGSYYQFLVVVSASLRRGDHISFTTTPPEWDQKLQEFCQVLGIRYQNPTWLLSYCEWHDYAGTN